MKTKIALIHSESESRLASCLTLCDPMDYTVHGILQARIPESVAFPFSRGSSQHKDWTQLSRISRRQILYQVSHQGSPRILEWVAYPFSSRSSWPRNRTRVSCIAGGFFTNWAICYSQKFFVLPRGGSRENKHEELHERRRNKRREEKQNTLRLFSLRALPAGNWPIQTWTPPLGESLPLYPKSSCGRAGDKEVLGEREPKRVLDFILLEVNIAVLYHEVNDSCF